jgi:hypothetical protein
VCWQPSGVAGRWPLLSALTLVMSWLTLRRDRPNHSAIARWLSGVPAATDAPIVASMPSRSMSRASRGRVPAVTRLVQQHEQGRQDQAVHGQREQPGRRAILAMRPAQAIDVGIADHRRESGHRADHSRRREADHPVPAHRLDPRRADTGPLDAGRGRTSELSR